MVAAVLTSAAGIVSLLDEPAAELKIYALKQLNQLADQFWPEIAEVLSKIEVLYEEESFPSRELAALVASKIYYNLGEFEESVTFALGAGKHFDVETSEVSEYVDTIIGKCIDKYIKLRAEGFTAESGATQSVDARLQGVVERMFKRCFDDKEYKQAIGIALESHRLDIVEASIMQGDPAELLQYTLDVAMTLVENLTFRNQVLRLIVKLYSSREVPDYIAVAQCLILLEDAKSLADMMIKLAAGDHDQCLLCYQVAFDSYENAKQQFVQKVVAHLPEIKEEAMETDDKSAALGKIGRILSGKITTELQLEFLYRNNKADLLILKNTKTALEARSSMYHSAISLSNAFMNCGTTSDQFLRDSLDWMTRASNWSKFTATAQIGVIHKGNVKNGMELLRPYLPQDGVSSSVYSESGSLFALGLVHSNHGAAVLEYLKNQLKNTQDEVMQHGASLGLGVAGMSTANEEIYEALKGVLFGDSAVAGEAAGLAMGLVMLGTANAKAIEEMLQYAHETQHEKIIRGLALGIAMVMYGHEDHANPLIDRLLTDKDPILRYSGVFTVAMAFSGTADNSAIRRMLHIAVSDASDDVRRAAVMALGFILLRNPSQVPRIVQLLAESYNPHVRYGAAFALGISCAGTGMAEALTLLEPLSKDSVDFVRQSAYIAASMILIQQNDTTSPKAASFRKTFEKVISAKHEDPMARFGAILGQGIMDAGGRNVTISLAAPKGVINMGGIAGMALFTQFWYWFPLAHFLSLAFSPTALIGLNEDLKMPKFEFVSNAKPSQFAYQAPTKPPSTEKIEKVATAVLSTTAKTKARAKKADKGKGDTLAMDIDEKKAEKDEGDEKMKVEDAASDTKKAKKEEPLFETLANLSRVVPQQVPKLAFTEGSRFVPIKKDMAAGILLMKDHKPAVAVEFVEFSTPKVGSSGSEEDPETAPPEPFEYTE